LHESNIFIVVKVVKKTLNIKKFVQIWLFKISNKSINRSSILLLTSIALPRFQDFMHLWRRTLKISVQNRKCTLALFIISLFCGILSLKIGKISLKCNKRRHPWALVPLHCTAVGSHSARLRHNGGPLANLSFG